MKEYILDFIKNIDEKIYPNTYIPVYQILTAACFGLFFGAFHSSFIWTILSYLTFEYFLRMATRQRKQMYYFPFRLIAISMSVLGIIFSKFIWGSRPLFKFWI